jgi:hypothetical protein
LWNRVEDIIINQFNLNQEILKRTWNNWNYYSNDVAKIHYLIYV